MKTKQLTLNELNNLIEQGNKEFENASKAEKRVIIAQDCILRVQLRQLKPRKGCFIVIDEQADLEDNGLVGKPVKDFINSTNKKCEVCAKGALFLTYVGRVNSFDFPDEINTMSNLSTVDTKGTAMGKLIEIFTPKQLTMIETAFERRLEPRNVEITEENKEKSSNFGWKYDDSDDRLVAICENIIKNKGTFKP